MQPAGPVIPFQYFNIIIAVLIIILLINFRKTNFLNFCLDTTADRTFFFRFIQPISKHCVTKSRLLPSPFAVTSFLILHSLMSPKTWNFAVAVSANCVIECSLDGCDMRDLGFQSSGIYFEISWLFPTNVVGTLWPANWMCLSVADIQECRCYCASSNKLRRILLIAFQWRTVRDSMQYSV